MRYRTIIFDLGNTLIYQQVDIAVSLDEMVLQLMPGVRHALEKLATTYLLGVLSNTTRTSGRQVRKALEKLEIAHLFTAVITSVDVGCDKPDSRMFEAMLKELCAAANETIMVGNDLEHDIRPAKALGLTTAYYCQVHQADSSNLSDYTFSSFDQLPSLIQRIEEESAWLAKT